MPQTTDSGAKKILGTDNWRGIFDVHNDTVDAYDGQIAGLQDGLAIIANGNTHAAIASGQFVYVKNHGSLATGLYKARAAIGANATLSTSNLAADSAGGLNDLQGQVDSLNSKMTPSRHTVTWMNTTQSSSSANRLIVCADIAVLVFNVTVGTTQDSDLVQIASIESAYAPSSDVFGMILTGDGVPVKAYISPSGSISVGVAAFNKLIRGELIWAVKA